MMDVSHMVTEVINCSDITILLMYDSCSIEIMKNLKPQISEIDKYGLTVTLEIYRSENLTPSSH
jgi:hypothetical protein